MLLWALFVELLSYITIVGSWQRRTPSLIATPSKTGGNNAYLSEHTRMHCRTPAGHPEGYLEAFGNIYRNFAKVVQAKLDGNEPAPEYLDFPTVHDGVRGMRFIDAVIESGEKNAEWIKL